MTTRQAKQPIVLTMKYGTTEIIGFEAPWRTEIYRPFEVHPREPWNREIRERTMALGPRDVSPGHNRSDDYNSKCPCCYLNISHTSDLHADRVGRTK